ncbi:MAG TPA: flavodoxin-dependent (E)-4-hydroxy-3-methylbut-2-enyl-diphosphate synthase [Candidatus Deferrimicrobium sp.]|nr:flavodoxin-dependent (E)-4-hydroxy-3-methylbut-2-enyl-diphosphate synthase [Candidatus Deferrimicrobium sp.]
MNELQRRKSRQIKVGTVAIGGDAPVVVQSMTNTDTRDIQSTRAQIQDLAAAGCELVRLAVIDEQAAEALRSIKVDCPVPLIADIHFDYRLALAALESGIDGLRLNPGNIGEEWKVREVVKAARERRVPIRIGVNAGSLEKELLAKYQGPSARGMVESALGHIHILEELGFEDIKVSLKASNVPLMLAAYRSLASEVDYPLHLGVTEAGTVNSGTIKSAVGIGALLAEGIGDTIRVSLTGDPLPEIRVAYEILKALNLRQRGAEIISCPTCGRTRINLAELADKVEAKLQTVDKPIKVAVMGCVVNGPGEAREADIGIAGGNGQGLIFKKGEIIARVPEDELLDMLFKEIDHMCN